MSFLLSAFPDKFQPAMPVCLQSKLPVMCLADLNTQTSKIVGLEWYKGEHGYIEPDCPCLAICFSNGRCQIMRHEADEGRWCQIMTCGR